MNLLTFKNIFYRGQIVYETELFQHVHTPEMLLLYDGNFLQFKRMPTLDECKESIHYLRAFHLKNGQDHVKLLFPENEAIPSEMTSFLKESGYDLGFLEMYAIEPAQFPIVPEDPRIVLQKVTNENWETFLQLKFEIDSEISVSFAEQKRVLHEQNFRDDRFLQLMAFYENIPAGAVDIIIQEDTVEIDGLVILDQYQKRGIGSQLQKAVMEEFQDKIVILVADGEDTPREMYKKQNYQYVGLKYETLRIFPN